MNSHKINKYYALLVPFLLVSACNGRPNFDILVFDFDSDCDGKIHLRLEHDPDPEVRSIKVEPEYDAAARSAGISFTDIGEKIHVRFRSGIECVFAPADDTTTNCHLADSTALANCTSKLSLYSSRYPSRGPGSGGSIVKNRGDEVIAPNNLFD